MLRAIGDDDRETLDPDTDDAGEPVDESLDDEDELKDLERDESADPGEYLYDDVGPDDAFESEDST